MYMLIDATLYIRIPYELQLRYTKQAFVLFSLVCFKKNNNNNNATNDDILQVRTE